jgi:hypothetical protein
MRHLGPAARSQRRHQPFGLTEFQRNENCCNVDANSGRRLVQDVCFVHDILQGDGFGDRTLPEWRPLFTTPMGSHVVGKKVLRGDSEFDSSCGWSDPRFMF